MAPRKAVGRVVFIYSNIYMVLRVERVESFIAADVSVFEMERAYHLDDYVDVTFDEGFVPSYIRNAKYVALALKWIMTPKRYTLVGSVNNIVDKGQDEKVYFATLQSGTPSHLSQFCSFSSRQFPQASSLKIRSSVAMIAVCNAATAKGESVSAVTSCWIVRSIAPSVGSLKDITLQYIRRVGPDEAVVTIDNETTLSTTTAAQPARGVGRILVIVNNDQDSYMIVHVPQKLIFAPVSSWESNRMYQLDDYVQIIYAPGEPSDIVRDCNHYARSIEFIKRPERRQFRARITTIYPDGIRAQAQIMGLEIFPRSVNIPASAMRPKTATLKNLTIGTEVKVLAILPAKEAINSEQELLWTARICVDSHENIDDVPPLTTTYEKPGSSRPRAAESDWDERPRAAWGTANIPSRHATPGSGDPRETVPFANDAHNIPYDSPPQEDAWNEADRKLRALAHYLLQKNNVRSINCCDR